jgi:hypothetical protein
VKAPARHEKQGIAPAYGLSKLGCCEDDIGPIIRHFLHAVTLVMKMPL